MFELPDVLDTRDTRLPVQAALCAWLSVQAHFAFRPAAAVAAFERFRDPLQALTRSGGRPLPAPALEESLTRLRRVGARGLPLTSPAYPERLRRLSDAAPLLWIQGDPASLLLPSVAIVGARASTAYGLEVAFRLAAELASCGICVVSGLARGIDAAAHEGALEAGGRTLAIQGCGPDRVYPRQHRALAGRIARSGAVVSELPPGTPPRGPHFPLRNRLISGLALAVVVVEARERSGSLVTARHALDQGGNVLVVPGPITAPTSRGSNALLRDGAPPVLSVSDVLREIGVEIRPPERAAAAAALPASHRAILETLTHEPLTRDELGRRLGRAPATLAVDLIELELSGRVVEDRDGRLRAVSPLRGAQL